MSQVNAVPETHIIVLNSLKNENFFKLSEFFHFFTQLFNNIYNQIAVVSRKNHLEHVIAI